MKLTRETILKMVGSKSPTVVNQSGTSSSSGGSGGGGQTVVLGTLLTSLNNDASMPTADGYLHWDGSAWVWDTPTGGDPVDLTPYAQKTWVAANYMNISERANYLTRQQADALYSLLGHTHPYLPLSAGSSYPLTDSLYISGNAGINWAGGIGMMACQPTSGWTGISSTQWGVGALSSQGVIRSNANDLVHYRANTAYTIWDSYNFTPGDYLPLAGGTVDYLNITGDLDVSTITASAIVNSESLAEYLDADEINTLLGNYATKSNVGTVMTNIGFHTSGDMIVYKKNVATGEPGQGTLVQTPYALLSQLSGFVTLDSAQTITGSKTMGAELFFLGTNGVTFNIDSYINVNENYEMMLYGDAGIVFNQRPVVRVSGTDTDVALASDLSEYATSAALLDVQDNMVDLLGTSGDYVTWRQNGTTNNLTVPFATTAGKLRNMAMANGDDYDTLSGYTYERGAFVAVNWLNSSELAGVTLADKGLYDTLVSFGYSNRTIQLKGAGWSDKLKYRHVETQAGTQSTYVLSAWRNIAFEDWVTTQMNNLGDNIQNLLAGYLPLTAGSSKPLSGSLIMSNATYLYYKDTGGTERNSVGLNGSNDFLVGYGVPVITPDSNDNGGNTHIYGRKLYFRYGSSRGYGMILDDSGYFGIGTTQPTSRLHVVGDARITGPIFAGDDIYINEGKGLVFDTDSAIRHGYSTDSSSFDGLIVNGNAGVSIRYANSEKIWIRHNGADVYGALSVHGSNNSSVGLANGNLTASGQVTTSKLTFNDQTPYPSQIWLTSEQSTSGSSSTSPVIEYIANGDAARHIFRKRGSGGDALADVHASGIVFGNYTDSDKLYVQNGHLYFNNSQII